MKLRHSLTPSNLSAAGLILLVAGLGMYGSARSLWLDEAWVANSVQAPSLHGMFFYSGWLQVNPPLFLLLVRAAVHLLGASNPAFRLIPLFLACVAAGATLAVARRLLPAPLALLAAAAVVFDFTAIEYSRTLKPYSGELAVTSLLLLLCVRYFQEPERRRFWWLLAAAAMALPLAYSTVFLLPGIACALVLSGSWSRGAAFTAVVVAEFLAIYSLFIRLNVTPELHAFAAAGSDRLTVGVVAALIFSGYVAVRTAITLARGLGNPREYSRLICVAPCLILAVCAAAGWYPVTHRTRLFLMPCLVLLAIMTVDDLLGRWATRDAASLTAWALAAGLAGFAIADQWIGPRETYEEDFAGAVAFLQHRAAPADLILVHACCKEGFILYSAMDGWNPAGIKFGDTGWPCCAPGENAPGAPSPASVIQDLDSKVPANYSGRVWLLYTTRPTHWAYTGFNEGDLWRKHLWERGCPPGPYLRFANLAISPMNCRPSS